MFYYGVPIPTDATQAAIRDGESTAASRSGSELTRGIVMLVCAPLTVAFATTEPATPCCIFVGPRTK